jgi:ABC-2 type transport system ATP-binding protein
MAMAEEGVTIVLSTHVLPQVDELCTHICLINRSRAILNGELADIRTDYGGNVWRVGSDLDEAGLTALPGVTSVHALGDEMLVELETDASPREMVQALAAHGGLESFTRFVPGLENIFIRAVEEDRDAH